MKVTFGQRSGMVSVFFILDRWLTSFSILLVILFLPSGGHLLLVIDDEVVDHQKPIEDGEREITTGWIGSGQLIKDVRMTFGQPFEEGRH